MINTWPKGFQPGNTPPTVTYPAMKGREVAMQSPVSPQQQEQRLLQQQLRQQQGQQQLQQQLPARGMGAQAYRQPAYRGNG